MASRGSRRLPGSRTSRSRSPTSSPTTNSWTVDSLRVVTVACIEAFGTERSMFASDFPVAGLYASFDEVFDSFKTITADFSPAEQAALFHDNARRFYRLDSGSPADRLAPGPKKEAEGRRSEKDAPPAG